MSDRPARVQLAALWKKTSASGQDYYMGKMGDVCIWAFLETDKRNERAPDLKLYVTENRPNLAGGGASGGGRGRGYSPYPRPLSAPPPAPEPEPQGNDDDIPF